MKRFNKPWQIALISFGAALILLFSYTAILVVPTISHGKSYISAIKSGAELSDLTRKTDVLNRDVNQLIGLSNLPIIRQVAGLFGFNFAEIQNEITSSISAAAILGVKDKPQTFLLAFQNSAEARGTGGILGAYAIVKIENGKFSVQETGSNAGLKSLEEIPLKMPAEYGALYRSDPAIWQNSNLSPHFPYGAEIWMELWRLQTGQKLDGVIAVDPTALSYILRATGPVTLKNGEAINSDNVVEKTLKEAYKRFEFDNMGRKQYLVDIMNETFKQLMAAKFSKLGMAIAIRDGILENRILVYSTNSDAEALFAKSRLGGFMDTAQNNEYRAVIENIDASKLDYYLERKITVSELECGSSSKTEVKISVTNTVTDAKNLSAYVLTRADKNSPRDLVTGQHRFKVFIYGPTSSTLISAALKSKNGSAGGVATERGRPLLVADVDLLPGQSDEVSAIFAGGVGKLTYVDQPLVQKSAIKINRICKRSSR